MIGLSPKVSTMLTLLIILGIVVGIYGVVSKVLDMQELSDRREQRINRIETLQETRYEEAESIADSLGLFTMPDSTFIKWLDSTARARRGHK